MSPRGQFRMSLDTGDGAGLMRRRRRSAPASSAAITANSWRAPTGTERLVEVDCFRKLLADEIIAPRQFAVARKLGMPPFRPLTRRLFVSGQLPRAWSSQEVDRSPAAATVNFRAEVQQVECPRWAPDRAGSAPYATGARSSH